MENNLDEAFSEFETEVNGTRIIRRELIENLRKVANSKEMAISPYDKPMAVQSKLMIFKTLDDLLKSSEDTTVKKIKLKLARKDSETNGMVGAQIAAMLKSIRVSDTLNAQAQVDPTEGAMDAIKQRAEELLKSGDKKTAKALTVTEGETTDCGGAGPTTSTPVAKLKPLKMETEEE